jgi:CHASE2 domain-containing sensor protein
MNQPLPKKTGGGIKNIHRRFTKYLLERDTFFATFWVFIFIVVLGMVPINFYFLNPLKLALKDFDFNDIAYAKLKKGSDISVDNRIVIINIGMNDREGIAHIIDKAASMGPKILGLDVTFDEARDPYQDSLLSEVIKRTKNLVLASKVIYPTDTSKVIQKGYFADDSHQQGFVNMVSKDIQTIRLFLTREKIDHKYYYSFASAIIKEFDSLAYEKLEKRHHEFELINYTRKLKRYGEDADEEESPDNKDQYFVIEAEDLLTDKVDESALKGKIALLGYVNRDPNDILDKKFTPMNKRFAGKATPDMNGIIVHANIISMVLDNNYIKKLPSWTGWLFAIVIGWIHMSFFIHYYLESHIWFHLAAKIAQLLSAIFFVYLGIYLFDHYRIKLDMKLTLIVIVMAVDVIYFYEAWASWMHKKYKYNTVFKPHQH